MHLFLCNSNFYNCYLLNAFSLAPHGNPQGSASSPWGTPARRKEKSFAKKKCRFVGLCAPPPHSLFKKSGAKTLIALRADFFTFPFRLLSHAADKLNVGNRIKKPRENGTNEQQRGCYTRFTGRSVSFFLMKPYKSNSRLERDERENGHDCVIRMHNRVEKGGSFTYGAEA